MYANLVYSLRYLSQGDWEECRKRLIEMREYSFNYGDQKNLVVSTILLEQLCYYHAEFEAGYEYADQVEKSVQHTNSPLHLAWCYSAKAENLLRIGRLQHSLDFAQRANDIYVEQADFISEIATLGLLAQLNLFLENREESERWVQQTQKRLAEVGQPTSFYFMDAYAGIAEYYLTQWEDGDESAREPSRKAVKDFFAFAKLFDIGLSRAMYYDGWVQWLDQKPGLAQRTLENAATEARKKDMAYEEGLVYYLMGRKVKGPLAKDYLNRARGKFMTIRAGFDLERTDALLSQTD
jgi:hypothetical protein